MDEITEKVDYQQGFWDVLGIAWRRKFLIVFPVIIGACISVYLIKTLPKIYQSSTLIIVEGQKVPDSIVKSAVSGSAQDRLTTIQQQILSRSFLQRIIEKFELYQHPRPSLLKRIADRFGVSLETETLDSETSGMEGKLEKIRENILVTTSGRMRLNSFEISYSGENPETVMDVTNELASAVIEQNLKIREAFVEGATDFLVSELGQIKIELEKQETQIGDYKRRHIGELPGQLAANLRALDRFQANLDSIQISKKTSQDRAVDLERMLVLAKRELTQLSQADSASKVNAPVKKKDVQFPPPPSPLMQRLLVRRQELSKMLAEYSEDYPDVGALKRNIRQLKKQVAQEKIDRGVLPLGDEIEASSDLPEKLDEDYTEVDMRAEAVMALQRQIDQAGEEFSDLVKREMDLRRQIRLYERRVENTPKREQEMVIMSRDYGNTQANYNSLLNKKMNAQISENLEKRQKGEQFRIIDFANLPELPVSPNTLVIAFLGILGGLGVGIGLVFISDMFDNSIRDPEEVERITSVLVLAEIPDFSELSIKSKKVVDLEAFSDRKKQLRRQGMKG